MYHTVICPNAKRVRNDPTPSVFHRAKRSQMSGRRVFKKMHSKTSQPGMSKAVKFINFCLDFWDQISFSKAIIAPWENPAEDFSKKEKCLWPSAAVGEFGLTVKMSSLWYWQMFLKIFRCVSPDTLLRFRWRRPEKITEVFEQIEIGGHLGSN